MSCRTVECHVVRLICKAVEDTEDLQEFGMPELKLQLPFYVFPSKDPLFYLQVSLGHILRPQLKAEYGHVRY